MRLAIIIAGVMVALLYGASLALAHDHDRPDLDKWYEALKVPNDGLALPKGVSCCHRTDCKQRPVIFLGNGHFQTMDDNGIWKRFTDLARITEPSVLRANPYFSWTVCIHGGEVVCYVRGRAGL